MWLDYFTSHTLQTTSKQKDYSVIEGYRVADYKEQPHTYAEDLE